MVCGSSNLRADRALSGRLICTSCGNPYGVRKVRINKMNPYHIYRKYWLFFSVLIVVFILVII